LLEFFFSLENDSACTSCLQNGLYCPFCGISKKRPDTLLIAFDVCRGIVALLCSTVCLLTSLSSSFSTFLSFSFDTVEDQLLCTALLTFLSSSFSTFLSFSFDTVED